MTYILQYQGNDKCTCQYDEGLAASICVTVVADESSKDVRDVQVLGKTELNQEQQRQIQVALDVLSDLTAGETVTFDNTDHGIQTVIPIQNCPCLERPD